MLEVIGIQKSYKGRPVLQNVSFTLAKGQCLGITGHNGSGKSTLLSVVAQVLGPNGGDIRCNGTSVLGNRAFLRQELGYVPQKAALLPDLTVDEILRYWQSVYKASQGRLYAAASPCGMLGLEAFKKKKISTLSGGMQKRVSIALALLPGPAWLLMDEVLPALDRLYRGRMERYLQEFKSNGGGILYCSHEISELEQLCDSILVLRNGQCAFYGSMADFPPEAQELDKLMNPI